MVLIDVMMAQFLMPIFCVGNWKLYMGGEEIDVNGRTTDKTSPPSASFSTS